MTHVYKYIKHPLLCVCKLIWSIYNIRYYKTTIYVKFTNAFDCLFIYICLETCCHFSFRRMMFLSFYHIIIENIIFLFSYQLLPYLVYLIVPVTNIKQLTGKLNCWLIWHLLYSKFKYSYPKHYMYYNWIYNFLIYIIYLYVHRHNVNKLLK